jgi:hypothetical protein
MYTKKRVFDIYTYTYACVHICMYVRSLDWNVPGYMHILAYTYMPVHIHLKIQYFLFSHANTQLNNMRKRGGLCGLCSQVDKSESHEICLESESMRHAGEDALQQRRVGL